ncbi:FAD/NAD(P)-binding domain-containing protein [Cyberlindnera jadinii NRRL Y-1542]|uniref:FAD/NAD(P)-binding domain-containing protein n=1 Tax=Cyberlindnera jadinii (strain ATCC 18201 / CBS 1600 / BCRC 20928 / JCM 3617 / NBRC 0987 / NRRL Y-1542) TaxID=983966 RepID=A0A1E4S5N8_CYBJN|nr:FAD/NAD(P)-binding domain-containing protein [Cyberlindnera jadinii NRRL Y-1542]ODV74811.1 FAD/NAD(P)-binding domain-containing protein [Cyberlindnera jadinii NRRL Y-1542]
MFSQSLYIVFITVLVIIALPPLFRHDSIDVSAPIQEYHTVKPKIAVIGAGAGGTSFSYYLQRYTSHAFDIKIFDGNNYIGGRSTTVGNYAAKQQASSNPDVLNSSVELGGSVFVAPNKILVNAVEEFGLTTDGVGNKHNKALQGTIGVWNGTEFVFKANSKTYLGITKSLLTILLRYGVTAWKLYRTLSATVSTFLEYFYDKDFPFDLNHIVEDSGLNQYLGITAAQLYEERSLNPRMGYELIQPLTLNNYGSNLNEIHAFGMMISMAAEDAMSVIGGNYQIFEKWAEWSRANVSLNTRVQGLNKTEDGLWILSYNGTNETFDKVIVAAPWQFTGIETSEEFGFEDVTYRELHVTYIESDVDHLIDHHRYKVKSGDTVPEAILGTGPYVTFYSANIVDLDEDEQRVRYKVFSAKPLSELFLKDYFFEDPTGVKIWFEKTWFPYPILDPISKPFDSFKVDEGLWYLNGIERFISTMETASLAGANVAALIAKGLNTTTLAVP